MDILDRIPTVKKERRAAVLVTVVEANGSTPRKAGARMLVYADGATEGTVGGGAVEHVIVGAAREVFETNTPRLVHHQLTADLQMGCGGEMRFFLEPLLRDPPLIVFGCGHVGTALIRAAAPLGFDIIALDDLAEHADAARLPEAQQVIASYAPEVIDRLPFGDDAYVVIVTRKHAFDREILSACVRRPTRYLGVIGSHRKASQQRALLEEQGVAAADIDRVHCPIGLDLGGGTPAEIAIAICAELIRVRYGAQGKGQPA